MNINQPSPLMEVILEIVPEMISRSTSGWKMKALFLLFLLIFFAFAPLQAHAAGDFSVSAVVDNTDVFAGESFVYQIQVDGEDAPDQPDLSSLRDFSVQFLGGQQNSSSSVTIINGKMTQDVHRGYIFSWNLTPKRTGTLEIPPITVTAGGGSARTEPVRIRADKPAEMDDFKLELSFSADTCYVGEPVTLTATWYIGQDVQQFLFNIPVLEDSRFVTANWDMPVDPNRKDQYLQVPLGNSRTIGVKEQRHFNGRNFTTLRFQKVLIPKTPGMINLEEATVSFTTISGYRNPAGFPNSFFDNFRQPVVKKSVIPSNTPALTVKPLPEAGKPSGFNGLVGQYQIEASADPTTVKVGDPITLTIRVTGPDYLDPVKLPPLNQEPELARNFRIPPEMAPGTINGNVKVFTQTLRAADAGVNEIPPIPLPYFDTAAGEYRVARSNPIPLKVSAARVVTAGDAEGISSSSGPAKTELENWAEGIAYNYEDLSVLDDQSAGPGHWLTSPFWIALLVGFPAIYAILFGFTGYRRSRLVNPEIHLRRKAYSRLLQQLKAIDPAGTDGKATAAVVLSAFRDYLAAKLKLPPGGRTWREIEAALRQRKIAGALLSEVKMLFHTCEAMGYGGIASDGDRDGNLSDRAAALAKQLERSVS